MNRDELKAKAAQAETVIERGADSLYGRAMQSKHGWLLLIAFFVLGWAAGKFL